MSRIQDEIDIARSIDRIVHEREERLKLAHGALKFGIPILDRCLEGIRKNDLVLVGAKSGAGKTELVSSIARSVASSGKRVHVFCLEAEDKEFERRIKYKLMAEQYFTDKDRVELDMNYRDWIFGKLDEDVERYELEAERIFEAHYEGLYTIYRKSDFSLSHFEKAIDQIKNETDLVIVDHLNYFDIDENVNENQAYTRIIKRIRDLALLHGVPMIVVAHLRKPGSNRGKKRPLMPDMEDFMGTSNLYKIATQTILMAPAPKTAFKSTRLYPTFFRVAKFRIDGSVSRFMARCNFDIERNEYERTYQLGNYFDDQEEFVPIMEESELPRWARKRRE